MLRIIRSLESTLLEGQKNANIDIQMMFANTQRCHDIVQQLQIREADDPLYNNALTQLSKTLQSNSEILADKIQQLNGNKNMVPPVSLKENSSPDVQKINRQLAIMDTIVPKGQQGFNTVAGLEDAKQALKEAIIMPLQFPHLFTGNRKPWRRILLYGPPGTGKSRLAQAVSSEISSVFYCVSSADLVSSWVGESEKLIKELFKNASYQSGRSVIFIDEIDSICRQRNMREEEHTRRIKTELLKQMEGADNSVSCDQIFLLCATNCPWELDVAFMRRFQKKIYIPLPDREARMQLLKIHTKDTSMSLRENDWNILASKTENYSGSDIANMALEALFQPIRELELTKYWKQLPDGKFQPCDPKSPEAVSASLSSFPPGMVQPRMVMLGDFLKSLQTHRKTVGEKELIRFKDFTESFGETGTELCSMPFQNSLLASK